MPSYAVAAEVALISAFVMRVEEDLCPLPPVPALPAAPVVAHAPAVSRNAIVMEVRRWLRRMRISLEGMGGSRVCRAGEARTATIMLVPCRCNGEGLFGREGGDAPRARPVVLDRACNGPQTWVQARSLPVPNILVAKRKDAYEIGHATSAPDFRGRRRLAIPFITTALSH